MLTPSEAKAGDLAGPAAPLHSGLQGPARSVAAVAVVLIPLLIWFAPSGIEPDAQHAFAIMAFVLLGWMTQILEPGIIGMIGIYLAWALGVVPFGVAFAGFANTTP
jgi:di/tricarboxylate transporter